MKTVGKPSPARSQGAGPRTPIRHKHLRSRSVSSARSNTSGKLAILVQQSKHKDSFVMSPINSRKSILSDNTEIEEPRRKSWWRKLGENSRDVIELLEKNNIVEPNNITEDLEIEILSQEKKNYTMDLPDSSGSESISSIVIPQRKLFTQKENQPHNKFGEIIGSRKTLAKLHKPSTNDDDKAVNVVTRELFQNKQRSKPIFPAALLNFSPNRTVADKTKEFATLEPKPQVRNIFGNRAPKRKNIFTNFIVSESEEELPEIQPKLFGFQKKLDAKRRGSSSSRGMREPSPTSSITTDIEMDDWKMLPSSTMVDNQLEITATDGMTPKRMRLSKLIEIESEAGSNATKQSSKSASSRGTEKTRKSKTFTKEKDPESDLVTKNKPISNQDDDEEIFDLNKEALGKSRKSKTFTKEKAHQSDSMTTRNKSKSYQKDDEEIVEQNGSSKDKSRKSKTFTKEKAHVSDSMTTRNKSKSCEKDDEDPNKSSKEKSRKSKTFTKEKTANLSSMDNKNTSVTSQDENEIFDQNLIAQNKSKLTIADQNTSQSSIKTRSQNKNNSPNSSKVNDEEPITDETITKKNKSKTDAVSPKSKIIESEKTPMNPSQDDDDDLNFSLTYEEEEEVPVTIQNDMSSGSMKVTYNSPSKNTSKETIQVTHEQIDHPNTKNDGIPMDIVENETRSGKMQQETVENQSGEIHVNSSQQVDNDKTVVPKINDSGSKKKYGDEVVMNVSELNNESKVEKSPNRDEENVKTNEIEDQNGSQEELEKESRVGLNESELEQNEVEDEEVSQNERELEQNEVEDEEVSQNDIEVEHSDQNESELEQNEVEDEEVSQNDIEVEHSDVEDEEVGQNECVVEQSEVEGEGIDQNESEVKQHEVDDDEVDQNESEVEHNEDESDEIDQNESEVEQNKDQSEEIDQNESEVEHNKDESDEIDQNESEEEQHEVDDEAEDQNESEVEQNKDQSEEIDQNESEVEQHENQEESDSIADSDNENDEANYIQDDVPNDSDNEDTNQVESGQVDDEGTQEDNELIETSNVSHDTTGRNRKKNESPEVILRNSKNHLESFAVEGRNTSIRKTEMIKSIQIRHSLESVRERNELSDGSVGSNGEGSGWDSHRTTRKTLRQTYGRDFTPRKSLRALVMEKSAKQTQQNEVGSDTFKFPQANSTELPETSNRFEDDVNEGDENQVSNHEVSLRTRQTTLETHLQKMKKKHAERRLKLEEEVRNSLNAPSKSYVFRLPAKPLAPRRTTKPKQTKSTQFFGELPAEVIEDFKYKPPKRFQPRNAPWITKRLYKLLESKLEAKYDYKARIRAEKLVENMYNFTKDLRRRDVASSDAVDVLKREMARLGIVITHHDFYEFIRLFLPREVRIKVIPDVINDIPLPRHGVFSDIL